MKKFLLAALAALVLVGCQHEQSELNFADIKSQASISGKVFYALAEECDTLEAGAIVPAANADVVVAIAISEYRGTGDGIKQYPAKTNANGEYLITIPIGEDAIDVEVEVRAYHPVSDGAFYTADSKFVYDVKAGDVKQVDDIMLKENVDYLTNAATLLGTVVYEYGYEKVGDAYAIQHKAKAGIEVIATVGDEKYTALTDNKGEFKFIIPIDPELTSYYVSLKTREFTGKFSELYDDEIQLVDAIFESATCGIDVSAGEETEMKDPIIVSATPLSDKQPAVLSDTVFYNAGYDAVTNETKNLKPAANAELIFVYNGKEYNVTTNASGIFSWSIPSVELNGSAVEIRLHKDGFEAQYTDATLKTADALFALPNSLYAHLTAGRTEEVEDDIILEYSKFLESAVRDVKIKLVGKILGQVEKKEDDPYSRYDGFEYIAATEGRAADAVVTFRGYNTVEGEYEELVYQVKANAEGEYILNAELYNTWDLDNTNYRISVADPEASDKPETFVHRYFVIDGSRWATQEVPGFYYGRSTSGSLTKNSRYLEEIEAPTLQLVFSPIDINTIKGIGIYDMDRDADGNLLYRRCDPFGWNY